MRPLFAFIGEGEDCAKAWVGWKFSRGLKNRWIMAFLTISIPFWGMLVFRAGMSNPPLRPVIEVFR